ncbi:MAG: hypothetical protein ACE5EC_08820, partial [Phycisphaerae bacterium]
MRYRLFGGLRHTLQLSGMAVAMSALTPVALGQTTQSPITNELSAHSPISVPRDLVPDAPVEMPVRFDSFRLIRMNPRTGARFEEEIDPPGGNGGAPRGGACPPVVVTHSEADFTGGQFVIQAGFVENEILAASYVLDPAEF